MYNLKNLVDAAYDESDSAYTGICEKYNGVEATAENIASMKKELRSHLEEYNEAADSFGGEAHTLDLSSPAAKAAIDHEIDGIVKSSVCTTDKGISYLRMGNWPTHDEDIKKAPSFAR